MGRADLTFQPRLMGAPEAAAYVGISQTTLLELGIPRRMLRGRRLFDRLDLDAYAGGLPYDQQDEASEASECDKAFGL
ncbi:helix-turn-helix domain-containing protein [Paracoccus sp. Z118]|uniref:helix-turn-helix domain-containing protein n=1 Tax=Paracoccus sp. Z118 TaxID=2851017 RepID=UPI001C2C2D3A|nr:helix-turn-helix domain-containing protein [Paracoccus sp. Z118]MBV0893357.1 helix-turn-helix domain-containing protein [Paracoccus sp. Z118]